MDTGPALVCVHRRNQQMPATARRGPAEETTVVACKRQAVVSDASRSVTGMARKGLVAGG